MASGLLAGVNPVAGLYAYMFSVASAALFTSTAFMAVQGTGAMAIIVNDVNIDGFDDPTRGLVTLSVLTGIVMMLAGYLKVGQQLQFVSNSVMTGFIMVAAAQEPTDAPEDDPPTEQPPPEDAPAPDDTEEPASEPGDVPLAVWIGAILFLAVAVGLAVWQTTKNSSSD